MHTRSRTQATTQPTQPREQTRTHRANTRTNTHTHTHPHRHAHTQTAAALEQWVRDRHLRTKGVPVLRNSSIILPTTHRRRPVLVVDIKPCDAVEACTPAPSSKPLCVAAVHPMPRKAERHSSCMDTHTHHRPTAERAWVALYLSVNVLTNSAAVALPCTARPFVG